MVITNPITPSRRSQRFQPTATPTSRGIDENVLQCAWSSKPIHVRKTIPQLDFLPEELEERVREDEKGEHETETVFYDAFRMKRKATAYRGSKRMKLGKTETQDYRIGDTVMVETDTLYIMKRPPSIGVIVAMWETIRKVDAEDASTDPSNMRIRVQWFLRPTELASIRAKRDHEEVCTYSCNL